MLRIIARLNIGGPAYHVSLLSGRMDAGRYSTLLAHGGLGPGEASFAGLARDEGCETVLIPTLGPVVKPGADLRTLRDLVRMIRRTQPDIVDTHTAKAGALGRLAVVLARPRPRPLVIHTYHGHVLEGHFGPWKTAAYRMIERRLARVSDCLIGVSQATVDDLVRLGIAPPESFRVVPLGLDLGRFARVTDANGVEFRMRAGAASEDILLTCVCRVVPRKRVDLPIRAVARLRATNPNLRLAVVGDGEHRPALERLARELDVSERVTFTGYMPDVAPVVAGADIAVLTSDSEGTPVSLIEAAAAGVPAIATTIGGVPEVVAPGTGVLVSPGDEAGLADAIARLAGDENLRRRMGRTASAHVLERFAVERLLDDMDSLYGELLRRHPA